MSAPMVLSTHAGLEVKARRRLTAPGAFDKLLEELQTAIQQKESQGQASPPVISDFDISQNKLSYEQFEAIFTQLGAYNARVLRFRLFGCATLNDDVARVIGDYIRLLTKENAPTEMHLSDCAITTDGFLTFISAFEETDLYPLPNGARSSALYLRLENNYISEAAIQEKVDLGVMKPYQKLRGSRASDGTTKIDLVVRDAGKYQQKEGEPPAPEDAPPPKEVYDKHSWDQKGGNSWQGGGGAAGGGGWQPNWQQGGQNWARPGMPQARPNSWGARPAAQNFVAAGALPGPRVMGGHIRPGIPPQAGVRAPFVPRAAGGIVAPRMASPGIVKGNPGAGGWPRGSAGTAAAQDRSRTPALRTNGGAARPPTGPPPGKKGDMPHPWEEHWSDEYQIPYFWNSETGDSLWEKPKF